MEEVIIETKCGKVKGYIKDGYYVFRGIHFANTPRFEDPIMINNWDGIYDATGVEDDCPQYSTFFDDEDKDSFYGKEFRSDKQYRYNENVVSLNIITKKENKNAPVVIFIHGGGFETGTVGELPYGDSIEYAKRDCLLVDLGYRLNIFGFYRSGSYGLKDMVCGIKWVKKYIEQFGGDPNRIIIMGQSAGAMSVTDLLYCQDLKGDITGAVMMSCGGTLPKIACPYTPEQSKEYWDKMLEFGGLKSDDELKQLTSEEVWKLWYEYKNKHPNLHCGMAGIDGYVINKLPQDIEKENSDLDVPIIVGITEQDVGGPFLYWLAKSYLLSHNRRKQTKAYGYYFKHVLPGNSYKAFHCADLWYMMGNLDKSWRPFTKEDEDLKDKMINYICNFAASGDPNGEGLEKWKPFTKDYKKLKVFDGKEKGDINGWKVTFRTLYYLLFDRGPL